MVPNFLVSDEKVTKLHSVLNITDERLEALTKIGRDAFQKAINATEDSEHFSLSTVYKEISKADPDISLEEWIVLSHGLGKMVDQLMDPMARLSSMMERFSTRM